MSETPLTWLLSELETRGLSALVAEYHSRKRQYIKDLDRSNKERKAEYEAELLEEARIQREADSKGPGTV